MYFSKKNKNYMYELISKLIHEETGIDISTSKQYIDIYRSNYSIIFDMIDTDEITVLNKELINHIGNIFIKQIKSENEKILEDKIESKEDNDSITRNKDIIKEKTHGNYYTFK